MKKSLILASLLALTTSSFAGDWYAGLGYGKLSYDSRVVGTAKVDDSDKAWKIYGGYKLNEFFSAELFYADLGRMLSISGKTGDVYVIQGDKYVINNSQGEAFSMDGKTIGVAAIGSYPIHKYFKPFLKLGFHNYEIKGKTNDPNLKVKSSEKGTDLVFGIGFETSITNNLSFRAELEGLDANDYDTDLLTFGFNYKF